MTDMLDFWPEDGKDKRSKDYAYSDLITEDTEGFRRKTDRSSVLDDPWGDF